MLNVTASINITRETLINDADKNSLAHVFGENSSVSTSADGSIIVSAPLIHSTDSLDYIPVGDPNKDRITSYREDLKRNSASSAEMQFSDFPGFVSDIDRYVLSSLSHNPFSQSSNSSESPLWTLPWDVSAFYSQSSRRKFSSSVKKTVASNSSSIAEIMEALQGIRTLTLTVCTRNESCTSAVCVSVSHNFSLSGQTQLAESIRHNARAFVNLPLLFRAGFISLAVVFFVSFLCSCFFFSDFGCANCLQKIVDLEGRLEWDEKLRRSSVYSDASEENSDTPVPLTGMELFWEHILSISEQNRSLQNSSAQKKTEKRKLTVKETLLTQHDKQILSQLLTRLRSPHTSEELSSFYPHNEQTHKSLFIRVISVVFYPLTHFLLWLCCLLGIGPYRMSCIFSSSSSSSTHTSSSSLFFWLRLFLIRMIRRCLRFFVVLAYPLANMSSAGKLWLAVFTISLFTLPPFFGALSASESAQADSDYAKPLPLMPGFLFFAIIRKRIVETPVASAIVTLLAVIACIFPSYILLSLVPTLHKKKQPKNFAHSEETNRSVSVPLSSCDEELLDSTEISSAESNGDSHAHRILRSILELELTEGSANGVFASIFLDERCIFFPQTSQLSTFISQELLPSTSAFPQLSLSEEISTFFLFFSSVFPTPDSHRAHWWDQQRESLNARVMKMPPLWVYCVPSSIAEISSSMNSPLHSLLCGALSQLSATLPPTCYTPLSPSFLTAALAFLVLLSVFIFFLLSLIFYTSFRVMFPIPAFFSLLVLSSFVLSFIRLFRIKRQRSLSLKKILFSNS